MRDAITSRIRSGEARQRREAPAQDGRTRYDSATRPGKDITSAVVPATLSEKKSSCACSTRADADRHEQAGFEPESLKEMTRRFRRLGMVMGRADRQRQEQHNVFVDFEVNTSETNI